MKNENITPEVGMGATEVCYSDRHAYTVIDVINPKKIVVRSDKAIRTDNNGMSDCQSYTFERDLLGCSETLSLRKNGLWVPVGQEMNCGWYWRVGTRNAYFDYSF